MSTARPKLLIVEDDAGMQQQLRLLLHSFAIHCAASRAEAVAAVDRLRPAVVLQDLGLPPDEQGVEEGFATITALIAAAPHTKIIVLTAHADREHAVRAVQLGAHDFCEKPFDPPLLRTLIERAIRIQDFEAGAEAAKAGRGPSSLDGFITADERTLAVCRAIDQLARSGTNVLVTGESGTGKERLARALHELGPRARRPWVALNCAAIPDGLLDSELFGYERGAFTGALARRIGQIERADGGTLFLDEIGDMPLALQPKLLRFLQERKIERIGGRESIPVDVRIVSATHQDLDAAMERGTFRSDLYYRLAETAVVIPPLRERGSDALLIATDRLRRYARRHGKPGMSYSVEAIGAIERHTWPGNVREIENRVTYAVVMAESRIISAAALGLAAPADREGELPSLSRARCLADFQVVQRALALTGGNASRAAELLGISRQTLYQILGRMRRDESTN